MVKVLKISTLDNRYYYCEGKCLFKIPVSFYPDATNKIHFLKNASGILETLLKIVLLFKCIFYESWVTFLFVYEIFVIS